MKEEEENISRRTLLKKVGTTVAGAVFAAAGLPSGAGQTAYGESSSDLEKYDFLMPRVKFECDMKVNDRWNAFPGGDRNLLVNFASVVRCRVKLPPDCDDNRPHDGDERHFNAIVDFNNMHQLRKYPFLFMTASGSYTLSNQKKRHLLQYIYEGGFLLMDDCVHGGFDDRDFFYQSSYELLEDVFGRGAVRQVPNEHEIFHNVYNLGDIGLPYMIGQDHGARGVFVGDRLAVFLSSTDIHCGWADSRGRWFGTGGKRGIGKHGYKEAIQMGINIIMYAVSH
ncbi:MAG: DUF4159 domain-containing protein [Planctomycetota bacterium]|jgi:hypothetical protein